MKNAIQNLVFKILINFLCIFFMKQYTLYAKKIFRKHGIQFYIRLDPVPYCYSTRDKQEEMLYNRELKFRLYIVHTIIKLFLKEPIIKDYERFIMFYDDNNVLSVCFTQPGLSIKFDTYSNIDSDCDFIELSEFGINRNLYDNINSLKYLL